MELKIAEVPIISTLRCQSSGIELLYALTEQCVIYNQI